MDNWRLPGLPDNPRSMAQAVATDMKWSHAIQSPNAVPAIFRSNP
jgi:hypothetical protein